MLVSCGGRKRKAAKEKDWFDLLASLKGGWTCSQDLILLSPLRDQAGAPVKGLFGKGPKFSKSVLCCLTHGCASPCFPIINLQCSVPSDLGHLYELTLLLTFELCP